MKHCWIIIGLIVFSLPSFAQGAPSRFFETLYDVPVMPGLSELPDKALVFDKPEGRIAQAGAAGKTVQTAQIRAFYAETLPQLGWSPLGADSYIREGEKLVLSIAPEAGYNVVRFTLAPAH